MQFIHRKFKTTISNKHSETSSNAWILCNFTSYFLHI